MAYMERLGMAYNGFRADGTIPNVGGLCGPPSKGHLGVCAIYSETTVEIGATWKNK